MVIIAAADGDTRPDGVVTVGADLADAFDDELVDFHAMTDGEFDRRREEREYIIDHAAEDAVKTARWGVTGTLDVPSTARAEGAVGEPVSEMLDLAEEMDAQYVVVGRRRRTPWGRLSSTASHRPYS